ncbi:MAG TPA: alkaline phosphatase family protein [Vicinamibacterales bacterium]
MVAASGGPRFDRDHDGGRTATPIKHVIVIIGENRTFDNVYGTYVPRPGQHVANLLSRGIVLADGSPGPQRARAQQSQLSSITPVRYFVDTDTLTGSGKAPYAPNLPTPEAGFAPARAVRLSQFVNGPAGSAPPFDGNTFSATRLHQISPVLASHDLVLLTTGATGLTNCTADPTLPPTPCGEPDTRVAHFNALPNTVFPITGPHLPFDSYTGDMVHRFFHMWQQSDCNLSAATASNPAGCRNDLYPYVGIARGDDSGANSMGFYNMQVGDAPLFKRLADEYTMSDNYHQPVMGGTAVQHMMMMTGDALPWDHVGTFPATPPLSQVADPTPQSASNPAFVRDGRWMTCDVAQPGIGPILDYLKTLPWRPDLSPSNCEPGRFYMINNLRPGFLSNGQLNVSAINGGTAAPPSSLRNIGDALNERHIDWAYYGGGFDAARRFDNGSTDPVDVLIGTGGDWYCDICNPFQYSASIMGDPTERAAHIKDAVDFFTDLGNGKLPAVSYIKPDSFDDGHPASSKVDLLEALIDRVIERVRANDDLFKETAIFVTFDEGGGYWDSGFFQPIDMFGDGPRIPFIVVSPYSRGGRVTHSYGDHASILKFIERNWSLDPLTGRSRDNLPNPIVPSANSYVPLNMPAIGDLFDMFDFPRDHDGDHRTSRP